jgi:hypothetical protein
MLVIIGKCEKCGSPIFSPSFNAQKTFNDTRLVRTCTCFSETMSAEVVEAEPVQPTTPILTIPQGG